MKHLTEMVRQHKAGKTNGIYAVCSAHPLVLEAAIRYASANQTPLLIEATSNQVDQFGGYTGMTPADFRGFVCQLADSLNFPQDALILGGDHLGPNRWQNLPAAQAMANADDLIKSYVAAGFKKIHLDCSMSCQDDPIPLTDDIVAERAARLAKVAEETCREHFGEADLEYVIGTEVPVPGGAHETLSELAVTTPDAARATLEAHRHAFEKQGLNAIWPRIIALVVQPGVEFDHTNVIDYQPAKAAALSQMVENYETLIFEAHSTDYQTPQSLRQLVIDHFAILKVGPALTFALREALFSLAAIEEELVPAKACSGLRQVLENVMLDRPEYWQSHYHGDGNARRLARGYSYSDRVRYYWPDSQIDDAFAHLVRNLADSPIPLPLISQYLPLQYVKVRSGELNAIWPRIIALVVQPGVEFDHTNVIDYQPAKAAALSQMVENYETLIFEAHSTDYQTPQSLRQLVIDHFAILKVGPALTFALREALFSLAAIEEELVPAKACSGLRQVLENVMLDRPEYWQSHYHGDGNARRLARGYSYSDRVRYYWPDSQIDDAFAHLVRNLADSPIPLPLISQYLPLQYVKVRSGELQPTPRELIINHIQDILAQYHTACEGQ